MPQPYEEQVWRYLIRQWRHGRLVILPKGQTDNEWWAVHVASREIRPTHVLDVLRDRIIFRNY